MNEDLVGIKDQSLKLLEQLHISPYWANWIQSFIVILLILLSAWLIDKAATMLMRKAVPSIIGRTKNKWDDIFLQNRVFASTAHFLPGLVVLLLSDLIASETIRIFIKHISSLYFIITFLILSNALINSFNDIYSNLRSKRHTDIKIYLQILKVVIISLGIIAIISIFANQTLMDLLKGLGAMITVLLIVYKDTIMGFVAGIQLSANKMLKVGDWVSIPQNNADGNVIDIGLTTVKVQNWDKTITTIPTYKMISESFTNWKGMQQSNGRRIKRYVSIDMDSIHFLTIDEIARYRKFKLLKSYIRDKIEEINKANVEEDVTVNQRRLTNIGVFRKYVENYLLQTEHANTDMTFMVRQLQPTELGLPIEIYMFCKEKRWAFYEQIQSDIFDHIFAMVPEFNLRIFQNPTGQSFSTFSKNL